MRRVIVSEAAFPDHQHSGHTAKRRNLYELQGQRPTVFALS
ncbi:MAG TPA: hypothetical protein VF749_11980 [Candidatus Acidoferrum sp.]